MLTANESAALIPRDGDGGLVGNNERAIPPEGHLVGRIAFRKRGYLQGHYRARFTELGCVGYLLLRSSRSPWPLDVAIAAFFALVGRSILLSLQRGLSRSTQHLARRMEP
jgi:hypothetical protein